jgi:hypothetical protein
MASGQISYAWRCGGLAAGSGSATPVVGGARAKDELGILRFGGNRRWINIGYIGRIATEISKR